MCDNYDKWRLHNERIAGSCSSQICAIHLSPAILVIIGKPGFRTQPALYSSACAHYLLGHFAGLQLVDTSEKKQIDCLRELRNKQCSHLADSRIADDQKVTIFTKVGVVYNELNWDKNKLHKIERDVLITEDFKEVMKKFEEEKQKRAGNCNIECSYKIHQLHHIHLPDVKRYRQML